MGRKKSYRRIAFEWGIMAVCGTAGLALSAAVLTILTPLWRTLFGFNEVVAKTVILLFFLGVDIAVTYLLFDSINSRVFGGEDQ